MTVDHKVKAQLFRDLCAEKILVKDGPYGTMIQSYNLSEGDFRGSVVPSHNQDQKGNNDLLNLSQPAVIEEIADAYLMAGADLVATNTFNANAISQSDYGTQALTQDINRAAAKSLRRLADKWMSKDPSKPRFVAGAVGPTNKTLSISPDVNNPGYREISFDYLKEVYKEQMEALLEEGVDFILIETIFDTLNAKAALMAVMEIGDRIGETVPTMVSMTITDMAGRNLSGQTPEAFWYSVRHVDPLTIGLNCSFGARELRPHLAVLSKLSDRPILAYPNAGLPNDLGAYEESPAETAELVKDWLDAELVNVVGGCCGTTPRHIEALSKVAASYSPRIPAQPVPALCLAGLEAARF